MTIATPAGQVQAVIQDRAPIVRPPIAWSPSGEILAAGPQGLFWDATGQPLSIGDVQHGMVFDKRGLWGWSPIADCGLQTDRHGSLYVTTVDPNIASGGVAVGTGLPMLRRKVESFAFSPAGHELALVIVRGRDRYVAIANLETGLVEIVRRFRFTCCVTLGGWSFNGSDLLYWAGSGASVMADGVPLQIETVHPRHSEHPRRAEMVPDPDLLVDCAGSTTGIVGFGRSRNENKSVDFLEADSGPVTPARLAVSGSTCDLASTLVFSAGPNGADPKERALYLIELAGEGGLQVLADDPDRADDRPEWATGVGVLFVRWIGTQGDLWFIPEGGEPRPLPLQVRTSPGAYWAGAEWDRVIDWSATPPTGLAR